MMVQLESGVKAGSALNTSVHLCWRDIENESGEIPAGYIAQGEGMHITLNYPMQFAFVNSCFPRFVTREGAKVWLQKQDQQLFAGECEFTQHVAFVLRHKGLMANLSMRENLMLPFACEADQQKVAMAKEKLPQVAEFLGLEKQLERQAGERSPYTHALVSLGHCLLKQASFMVVQEVDFGLSSERLQLFRDKLLQVIQGLQPGILYLSASNENPFGLQFEKHWTVDSDQTDGVSGIW